jgi:hypothetical protein
MVDVLGACVQVIPSYEYCSPLAAFGQFTHRFPFHALPQAYESGGMAFVKSMPFSDVLRVDSVPNSHRTPFHAIEGVVHEFGRPVHRAQVSPS